jgi:hypothetical protein
LLGLTPGAMRCRRSAAQTERTGLAACPGLKLAGCYAEGRRLIPVEVAADESQGELLTGFRRQVGVLEHPEGIAVDCSDIALEELGLSGLVRSSARRHAASTSDHRVAIGLRCRSSNSATPA